MHPTTILRHRGLLPAAPGGRAARVESGGAGPAAEQQRQAAAQCLPGALGSWTKGGWEQKPKEYGDVMDIYVYYT